MDFPLQLTFKLAALSPQVSVTDAHGKLMLYVKQKVFKLKEAVTVFADQEQTRPLFHINADRILDLSARYTITAAEGGAVLGAVQRQGMRSFWKAHYDVVGPDNQPLFAIREENAWVKVADGLLTEIPVLGLFSGYLFHPAYRITRGENGPEVARVKKESAFFEGRYSITKSQELSRQEEGLAVLSVLMMVLLERRRG